MAITQTTVLPLEYGSFTISYHVTDDGDCISVRFGDLQNNPIVRIHSSCLFGESLHALDCECAAQLTSTLKLIKRNSSGGVVVYRYDEGRGIGLENKIKVLDLQRTQKLNTVEAFKQLGFLPDLRTYKIETEALRDLNVPIHIKAATQNPHKLAALRKANFTIVEEVHPPVQITKYNINELKAKKELLGYHIELDETFGAS